MIYTIGGIKGGSGKTTLATNLTILLARSGRDVLLIDADAQGSSADFSEMRSGQLEDIGYTAIQLNGVAVRTQVEKLKEKYDDIVIDAGGRDTTSQRAAVVVSDVFISPFIPSSFDMWTLEPVIDMIEEMKPANPDIRAFALLNGVDPQGNEKAEAKEYIEETSTLKLIDASIGRRKAFRKAASTGLSVVEYKPVDHKAINEISAVFDELMKLIQAPAETADVAPEQTAATETTLA